MSAPVDLSNFKDMTSGNPELEKELFDEFITSSENIIKELKQLVNDADNEAWRKAAHSMKGTALILGADNLGKLCKDAQLNNAAPAVEKQKMIDDIDKEYGLVKEFINANRTT